VFQLRRLRTGGNPSVGDDWIVRYTQYRYYSSPSRLKAVYEHDAIARIVADNSGIADMSDSEVKEILSKGDSDDTGSGANKKISDFASRSFTYHGASQSGSTGWPGESVSELPGNYGGTLTTGTTGMVASETVGAVVFRVILAAFGAERCGVIASSKTAARPPRGGYDVFAIVWQWGTGAGREAGRSWASAA